MFRLTFIKNTKKISVGKDVRKRKHIATMEKSKQRINGHRKCYIYIYIYMTEYYSALKKEILSFVATQNNLEDIRPCEVNQE